MSPLVNDCNQFITSVKSACYAVGFVIKLLVEHDCVFIKVVNQLKFVLLSVAFLQHLPQMFCLWFGKTIVDDIASSQNNSFVEQQFCE